MYFPGNKTTINFNEFCELYNEYSNNKDIHEELLKSCFNSFDYDK